MLAQFHGTCSLCDDPIVPGQAIVRDDTDDTWQHETCGSRPDVAPCACSRCFLVHAGECF